MRITLTDGARELLAKEGFDPVFGARPLKRVIQRKIGNVLASKLLEGKFEEGDNIAVDVSDGELTFKKLKRAPSAG